jgi:pimeloyl-ACP methyl ester carboxylesterase
MADVGARHARPASDTASLVAWASPWLLSTQFDPGLLVDAGYEPWRQGLSPRLRDLQEVRVVFETALVPGGAADQQSGLLVLPAPRQGEVQALKWVVWTRATELERKNAPSAGAGFEVSFARVLAALGWAVWMPDYAGMGESPGPQTYCVPDSQALSAVDGLAAARALVRNHPEAYRETGDLALVGYSQGGQASMATAQRLQAHPDQAPGLVLRRVYALAAPFDLMIGAGPSADPDAVLERPEYTLYLVFGWARAYPDVVDPSALLQPAVLGLAGLFDGKHSGEQINRAIRQAVGNPARVTTRHLFLGTYSEAIRSAPESSPYYRAQKAARLDRWVPGPGTELVLGAAPGDLVVNPQNTANALAFAGSSPGTALRMLTFRSPTHGQAGGEGLLYAVMDLDRRPWTSP